jgi:hypothetical protein
VRSENDLLGDKAIPHKVHYGMQIARGWKTSTSLAFPPTISRFDPGLGDRSHRKGGAYRLLHSRLTGHVHERRRDSATTLCGALRLMTMLPP